MMVTETCARDVMSTPVVVVRVDDSLQRAVETFAACGLRHLVVLDRADGLAGVLDDRQLLAEWPIDVMGLRHRTVGQLVGRATVPAPRLHLGTALSEAGQLMLGHQVDALAVVDEQDRVVGIVTGSDLVRALSTVADPHGAGE